MLRLATMAEKVARDALTHAAWGQRLTAEEFLRREATLRAHPWAHRHMRTWLWLEAKAVVASCETFSTRARLSGQWAVVECVASVFVEPSLRGHGYATALMKALVETLRAEAAGVALFSDVGAGLYERAGVVVCDAAPTDTVFDAARTVGEKMRRPASESPPSSTRSERADAYAPTSLVEWRDALVAPNLVDDALVPTVEQLDWHVERERFYRATLGRPPLRFRGVSLGASRLQWASFDKEDELVVLDAHLEEPEHAPLLIQAAQHLAFDAGLERVRLWGPTFAATPGARVEPRDGSLPMALRFDGAHALACPRGAWV